ncbi:uncharacterized protein MELLADRAFT_89761 [Melampsora larici-populina 98AG31]|uniref:Uncharacterized protein n=1 Tax=Melampsora larici-populina (strain 98AG31 / pathotype 3-4-7) TaxID=747676 RepID=F4RUI8_MELLP|nr:uncharacterized protein MELLADRAFT_89761 [Melampsora larici-populina 98AG31]EGG03991.1 hypothetical protein MELLADRAFT_89761 [Melampsora larici-populina 98AG31]
MSRHMQTRVFLPASILNYIPDGAEPRIDINLLLSQATNTEIVKVILAFYPHFQFTQAAQEDRELLRMIFIEMVAGNLRHLAIPSQLDLNYCEIPLRGPIFATQESPKLAASSADIDFDRTERFTRSILGYLTIGKYRLAGKSLIKFVKDFKFLNQGEIDEIEGAHAHAEDAVHNSLVYLQKGQSSIEHIQLLLRQSDVSQKERAELDEKLRSSITALRSKQKTFDCALEDVAFLRALADYHWDILQKHQSAPPEPSSASDEEQGSAQPGKA